MKLTLRARLAITYGALLATTIAAFGVFAYVTVSNELYKNLDASLTRAGVSLLQVLRREQQQVQKPLTPMQTKKQRQGERSVSVFERSVAARDLVGPVLPEESPQQQEDPVWSAVYEHMLLNSSSYMMQVANPQGSVLWRTGNLVSDSLPLFRWFEKRGATVIDDKIYTYYTINSVRYRLVLTRTSVAEVTAAYPVGEVDATLRSLFSLFLYSIPVAFAFSLIAGWFIASRSLKPVDSISRSARQISAENLTNRLPMPETNDEIARLTETLNEMIARLETSFTQIKQFTSDASHELKTPLAILMGELEVALKRPMSAQEYRETIESCLEEVERLTNVIQGLLDLSRADSGQELVQFAPVRLSVLVEDVCDDLMIISEQKHITFTSAIEPDVTIEGDKMRLHQALLNIFENALKYTPQNGTVHVTLASTQEFAIISVRDNGIGIPKEQLPYIFDRFFRVDKARSQNIQGSGLGLSITKWIVEAHRGTIQATSTEHEGTTFVVSLPRTVNLQFVANHKPLNV